MPTNIASVTLVIGNASLLLCLLSIGQSLAVQPNWWYDKRFQATGGKPTEKAEETKLPKGTAGSAIENTQTKEELDLIKQHEKALMAEALY